jgi:hypothetical protein
VRLTYFGGAQVPPYLAMAVIRRRLLSIRPTSGYKSRPEA